MCVVSNNIAPNCLLPTDMRGVDVWVFQQHILENDYIQNFNCIFH